MFWSRGEEETFKPKKGEVEEKIKEEKEEEPKANAVMERLETIIQQVNLISNYLANVSRRVSKAIDASVAYQRDLDDLERRIGLIKSRMEELEHIVPEIELEKRLGKKAA